jgi:hypothetical protein
MRRSRSSRGVRSSVVIRPGKSRLSVITMLLRFASFRFPNIKIPYNFLIVVSVRVRKPPGGSVVLDIQHWSINFRKSTEVR